MLLTFCISSNAQDCPPNIDFEEGTFNGWTCYTGGVAAVGGQNVITLTASGPIAGRHTIMSAFPGDGMDPYGNFPVNCPNGSGHSIKLGNTSGGAEAEGVSYEFVIPAGVNEYNLIYHYAVVFQDPNHQQYEQPRMEIEITNVTDNKVITCSSFAFFPYGTPLPGFEMSENPGGSTPVWFKKWSAVSINLDNNAGKRIRLFFKTADCTFRRHFGYAYIDVNSECSGRFEGASFCPDDSTVNVVAPYGYQGYTWYNSTFTQVLGTQQTLTFTPPPATSMSVAVVLTPYDGYGCVDTLYTDITDNLVVEANAGPDTVSCNHNPVPIGSPPKLGIRYQWTPAAGLSNPDIANPLALPDITTTYVLTARSNGGGCLHTDTVIVKAALVDNSIQLLGKADFCIGSGDSAVLIVQPADSIQWFRDNVAIPGATSTIYRVTQTGLYYAILFGGNGCSLTTVAKQINIASVPVSAFSVNKPNQCLFGNQYILKNNSTNAVGGMVYKWTFGDGNEANTRDVTYSYKKAGKYTIKLVVSSISVCADSTSFDIVIYQNAVAAFAVEPTCFKLPVTVINNTQDTVGSPLSYSWSFGNGQTSVLKNPPPQIYTAAGSYNISLAVSSAQCPFPVHTTTHTVVIDRPKPATSYPLEWAVINLPLDLHARSFGETVLWNPAVNLDNATSYNPVFKGTTEQLYTIDIKTKTGCVTTDTQMVKIVKSIEIFVPNAFTPNGDGFNDDLKPVFYGIKQLKYFRVYNRWGQLFYQTQTMKQGWDGTFKNVKQEMQTVVWVLEALGVDGVMYTRRGTSILLR
ncbi:PKD domain-containing protein [Ferruginibacter sp. SUN106]|uniref:PKD domain-containing protein n=1 Tax=Ferruginibacter sp. SUN106 TaxID=2978348 RepID=UPI003D35F64D